MIIIIIIVHLYSANIHYNLSDQLRFGIIIIPVTTEVNLGFHDLPIMSPMLYH